MADTVVTSVTKAGDWHWLHRIWSTESRYVTGAWKLEQVKNVMTRFCLMTSYPVKGINFEESDYGLPFMYHYV